jgi:hypothetical protein
LAPAALQQGFMPSCVQLTTQPFVLPPLDQWINTKYLQVRSFREHLSLCMC